MSPSRTARETDSNAELLEGRDYYLEGPAIVFTAGYLLRRGYCCENGCRHCPYGEFTKMNPHSKPSLIEPEDDPSSFKL